MKWRLSNMPQLEEFLQLAVNFVDSWYVFNAGTWNYITPYTPVPLVGDNRTVILRTPRAKIDQHDLGCEVYRILADVPASPADVILPPPGWYLEGEMLVKII